MNCHLRPISCHLCPFKDNCRIYIFSIALISSLLILLCFSLLSRPLTIQNVASIKTINLGIYEDMNCSDPLTFIDWGIVEPNSLSNKSAYLQNEANTNITCRITTEHWKPTNASNYITLSWDYQGTLSIGEIRKICFFLEVSSEISNITDFSFTILLIGEG